LDSQNSAINNELPNIRAHDCYHIACCLKDSKTISLTTAPDGKYQRNLTGIAGCTSCLKIFYQLILPGFMGRA
jgi:hypothetical protein